MFPLKNLARKRFKSVTDASPYNIDSKYGHRKNEENGEKIFHTWVPFRPKYNI